MSPGNPPQARSRSTRTALMRAAERLIAEQGIQNVTIRAIVTAAGQKNESALQYHFGGLQGLIDALHEERAAETQARREMLLDALVARAEPVQLRDLCALMVRPTFDLARSSAAFRRYIKAFGHAVALTERSALAFVSSRGGGGVSGAKLGNLLVDALPHLDRAAYERRMEAAIRLSSASMFHQAQQRRAFQGAAADLFVNSLIDALVGLLSAPESAETRALSRRLRD